MAELARFNPNHAAAGEPTGGQFAPAAGSGSKKAPATKEQGKAPAKKDGAKGSAAPPAHTPRERLLAEAHADRERARELEHQLRGLEHQHAQAVAAAKHSAAQAAAAKKAGHVVHHRRHTAAHHRHRKHAATLATRIGRLRTEIHTLREKASALEKQAKSARSLPLVTARAAGQVTNPEGTEKLHEYWVHGEGAAKIAWGTPGDFDRCVMHLGKFIRDPKGYCAQAHHDALGIWPATHAAQMKAGHTKSAGRPGMDRAGMNSSGPDGEFRTMPLSSPLDVAANGDGLTFSGYAAVYNRTARISATDGDFDEQIMPGAFRAVAAGAYPKLMFEHGRHPLIGTMPLGKITDAREDDTGLWIEARLTDNWLISPVRDAVANEALDGMSFRFTVDGDDGETWTDRQGDIPLRSLMSLNVPELGPVVFPAYEPTTANVRSVLDKLPVIGRPQASAGAASDRDRGEPDGELQAVLSRRFSRDGEALALRGIGKVRI
jgi:HK97 family phage prohead protease